MKLKQFLCLLVVCMTVTGIAGARMKKAKTHFKLITAYTKKIAESEQTNPPMKGNFFVVRWESASYPETFFWRGDGGWFTCNIDRARKTMRNGNAIYKTEQIDIAGIRKGDTLMLTPVTGGRFPIPSEIPENAKNTLFYKVNGSAWLAFPVKKIVSR